MPPRMPTLAPVPSTTRVGVGPARCAAQQQPPSQAARVFAGDGAVGFGFGVAGFSTTASRPKFTQARRAFREWEANAGRELRRPQTPGQPNYIRIRGDDHNANRRPFPMNPHFKSPTILDEYSRETIWKKVMIEGESIKAVSAEFGVDIRRVAAIVRLKEVEKDWIAKGKRLAKPYAKAVLDMLPTWRLSTELAGKPFEPINELHVHPFTMQQIFWPTSESRHFTREDAAKAFHPKLLSADRRVPHPELIEMERQVAQGRPLFEASEQFKDAAMESELKAAERQIKRAEKEERMTTRVNTERFEFRFKQFNSENVGPKGRSRRAVGWRYGTPFDDRSKGHQIKIPTSVP